MSIQSHRENIKHEWTDKRLTMGFSNLQVHVQWLLRTSPYQSNGMASRRNTGAHLFSVHLLPYDSEANIRSEERPDSQLQQSDTTSGYSSE